MLKSLENIVKNLPIATGDITLVVQAIAILLVLGLALVIYIVSKYFIVRFIHELIGKTKTDVDDVLVKRNLFARLALLTPAIVIYKLMPQALVNYQTISAIITTVALVYVVITVALIVDTLIDSAVEIYYQKSKDRHLPIKSFAQVCKLVVYFLAIILVISLLIGQSPMKLFAGLGAMAAILMLVFKDPILGFVAGIQLSSNKMVGIGDWVEMPQHNADGDIMEVGLTTVKVRNFDNTITTVPTQSLINDSFKNWRGMQESGGRRIKRALHIDISSVQFCDESMLDRYSKIQYITEHLQKKLDEVNEHNKQANQDLSSLANGRRLTNVGTFRAYIQAYLERHPDINQDLTLLVRQLEPGNTGLPIEVYAFSRVKDWVEYESIQADIFDHLIAVASEFDLKVFQQPSGSDFQLLSNK